MKNRTHIIWIFLLIVLPALVQIGCSEDASSGTEEGAETALPEGGETGLPGEEIGTETGDETIECIADCENKNCGSDGCGGVCGNCPLGSMCDDKSGTCQCLPNCEGKICGDNGCGGSCGQCNGGLECSAGGQCICAPQCAGKECGDDGCSGSCGDCPVGLFCDEKNTCGAPPCVPECTGKACGDDGCGASCGNCGPGLECNNSGQCEPGCTPNCAGKECGGDGCGALCGICGNGEICGDDFQCVPGACTADCAGKACGDNGCGDLCGTCNDDQFCNSFAQCEQVCIPDCSDKACGNNGCGGSCGACPAGYACEAFSCIEADCTPDCDEKACGDDGCGNSCGICIGSMECNESFQCDESNCTPDCDGKTCGFDGCGDVCGSCPQGQDCFDFACAPGECVPSCDLTQQCGDDGCGGLCGVCSNGQECNSEMLCVTPGCQPDCQGKQCGGNGCGDSCGECGDGQECGPQGLCIADPGDADCASFFACTNACEQDENCIDECLATTSEEGIAKAEALTDCIASGGCANATTQEEFDACVAVQCEESFHACFPPVTGAGNCSDYLACTEGCAGVQGCLAACEEAAAPDQLFLAEELLTCLEDAGCQNEDTPEGIIACQDDNCADQQEACYGTNEVSSGSCSEFFTCSSNCEDEECVQECAGKTDPNSLADASAVVECLDTNGCYDAEDEDSFAACADSACADVLNACFDSEEVPSGDCCAIHDAPGCNDDAVESCVCQNSAYCCSISWDESCVDSANACGANCGSVGQSDGSCADFFSCANTCGDDVDCVLACSSETEPTSLQTAIDTITCLDDNGCYDLAQDVDAFTFCANSNCAEELAACFDEPDPGPTGPCCETHEGTGCEDADVTACVCETTPYCCAVSWDAICVDTADTCGAGCTAPATGDCNDYFACNSTCEDEDCSLACAMTTSPAELQVASDLGACLDENGCFSLTENENFDGCAQDFCGSLVEACFGPPGVAEDCCAEHDTPGCNIDSVENCVCDQDAFCCTISWDGICVDEAFDDCDAPCDTATCPEFFACTNECPDGEDGCIETCLKYTDPFQLEIAENLVGCLVDNGCFDASSFANCAADSCADAVALCYGVPSKGDCCISHSSAGCGNSGVEECVCSQDLYCCTTSWDGLCVNQANEDCDADCPGTQPCCVTALTPGCGDTAIQNCVCEFDGYCCSTAWDGICVEGAESSCGLNCDGFEDSCCISKNNPGCNLPEVVDCVCDQDNLCCTTSWDQDCANVADLSCGAACDVNAPECCDVLDGPGCGNGEVEECVCNEDPTCCSEQWSDDCVELALTCGVICDANPCVPDCAGTQCGDNGCGGSCGECVGNLVCNDAQLCADPDKGSCCVEWGGLGCELPAVESCVCDNDPFCCNGGWDEICVGQAIDDCDASCP